MDDQLLLARYVATQDAVAFEEIARRHAGLVKSICLRVLGNSHDAEEVTQECFLELARHAEHVHSSVVGWLHRSATSRSLNVLRSRHRRRFREQTVGQQTEPARCDVDATTQELRRIIETTLADLPDDLRLPMILHYFDGRSQRDVAVELGVNQSTISRRMHDALQHLRERLARAGYVASAPAVVVLMQDQTISAAESPIVQIAGAGVAGKAVSSLTIANSVKGIAVAAAPIVTYLALGGWMSLFIALALTLYVAQYRPIWIADLMSSLGAPDLYDNPTFCLRRWSWTTPPADWRSQICSAMGWSAVHLGLAAAFALGTAQPPWGIVTLGALLSVGFAAHAGRLWQRVRAVRSTSTLAPRPPSAVTTSEAGSAATMLPAWNLFDAVQLVGIGLAAVGVVLRLTIAHESTTVWPAIALAGLVGAGMLISGLRLSWSFVRKAFSRQVAVLRPAAQTASSSQTQVVLALSVSVVVGLSACIAWNPTAVRGLALSLAAIQTSMLGWVVYRLSSTSRRTAMVRVIVALLVACFVMNSGVCLANWMR